MTHSFTEYIENKEIKEIELNEDLATLALSSLGLASAGLVITWGSLVVVKGYIALMNKSVNGIIRSWKGIFKKKPKREDVSDTVSLMKRNQAVKVFDLKEKKVLDRFDGKLDLTIKAIEKKDRGLATEELKKSGISKNPEVNRVVIEEIVKSLGEPPIHFGNTGNESYLFIKSILGIKTAKIAAEIVKDALNKNSKELIKDIK